MTSKYAEFRCADCGEVITSGVEIEGKYYCQECGRKELEPENIMEWPEYFAQIENEGLFSGNYIQFQDHPGTGSTLEMSKYCYYYKVRPGERN